MPVRTISDPPTGPAAARPLAQRQELGAAPGAGGSTGGPWGMVARALDVVTEGRKGGLVTEAIIASGYAQRPDALRGAYREAPASFDRYFEALDVSALGQIGGPAATQSLMQRMVPAALGFGVGAGLLWWLMRPSHKCSCSE